MKIIPLCIMLVLSVSAPGQAADAPVFMEGMTWQEIKERLDAGATSVIVPTAGTEQNGPQLATGKHHLIVHYTAGEIARKLGNALVAPVMDYVPEGAFDDQEGHMRFPGTFSLRPETFAAFLEDTATSLKRHGFKRIYFIGDHGASQDVQAAVAKKLSEQWKKDGVTVLQVGDYYAKNGQAEFLKSKGEGGTDPGAHAGIMDSSELLAIHPYAVRKEKLGKRTPKDYATTGAMGDSTNASPKLGEALLNLKIDAAVKQIEHAITPEKK